MRPLGPDLPQGLLAIRGRAHLVVLAHQELPQELDSIRLVVDNQDARHEDLQNGDAARGRNTTGGSE